MSLPQIIILAWLAFSAFVNVLVIGKPRKPVTPAQAVVSLLVLAVLASLVVIA